MLEITDAPTSDTSPETKHEKKGKAGIPKKSQAAASSSSSSSMPAPETIHEKKGVVKKTIEKHKPKVTPIVQKGVEKDETKNRSYWANKNIGYLVDQLQLTGHTFKPGELKGKEEYDSALDRKVTRKVPRLSKADLFSMIYAKDGI